MAAEKIIVELQVVDGQAVAAWKNQDGLEQKQLLNAGLIKQEFTDAYQKITTELSRYTQATELSATQLSKFMLAEGLTAKEIEGVTRYIAQQNQTIALNSNQYKENIVAIQNLQNGYMKAVAGASSLAGGIQGVSKGSTLMNMVIMQSGYALGDSAMFATNFRMGLMGVANNIPMIVQYMQMAREETIKTGTAFKTALAGSLMGTGGVLLAINGLMFLLQVLVPMLTKTTAEVKAQSAEVDKLNESYKKLIDSLDKITNRDEVIAKKGVSDIQLGAMKDQLNSLSYLKDALSSGGGINVDESSNLKYGAALMQAGLVGGNVSPDKALTQFANDKKSVELLGQKIEYMKQQVAKESEYNKALADNVNLTTVFANKKKETAAAADKELIKKDAEIEKEIALYEAKLKTNQTENERYETISKILKLNEQLHSSEIDREAAINKMGKIAGIKGGPDFPGINSADFKMSPVNQPEETAAVKETNAELERKQFLNDMITDGYNEAASAAISAGAAQMKLFKDSNNLANIFLNTLIKVVMQTLALKAATAILGIFTGGTTSILSAALPMPALLPNIPAPPNFAEGGIVTGPTYAHIGEGKEAEAILPLSKLSGLLMASNAFAINSTLNTSGLEKLFAGQMEAINNWQKELSFKMDLFDMKTANDRANDVVSRYEVK